MNWFQKIANLDLINQVRQSIPAYFPSDLQEEIFFQLDMYAQPSEIQNSFFLLYTIINDIQDYEGISRKWVIAIRKYLIELGVYRAWSTEELNNMIATGGKKYDFKADGKYYIFEKHPEGFV